MSISVNFIEIGCADFRTLAQDDNAGYGISIEPVKEYFDRLPKREGCILINKAVSDKFKKSKMYYYPRDVIEGSVVPLWFCGSHSIDKPHQPCLDWLESNGLDYRDYLHSQDIDTITLEWLFNTYNISEVGFLKIDAEGHDYTILKSLFSIKDMPLIHRIQYESNLLMTDSQRLELKEIALSKGYKYRTKIFKGNEDTILEL